MKKILCVDDDPRVIRGVTTLLKKKGYEVHSLTDSTKVDGFLQENEIDLVVLDVQMPDKDGLQIFDELKATYADFPVLFLTGYPEGFHLNTPEQIERWKTGFMDGRTDLMYKPFSAETLYDKIEALVSAADPAV